MDAQEIINIIATSEKKTPVKCYIKEKEAVDYGNSKVFGAEDKIVFVKVIIHIVHPAYIIKKLCEIICYSFDVFV